MQPFAVANCLTARMHKGINSTLDEGQTPVITRVMGETPCAFCGYPFDQETLGRYGCPNCEGEGLDEPIAITQFGDTAGTRTARHDSSPCADREMNVIAYPLTAGMAASASRMPHEQGALVPVTAPIAFSSKDHGADATADLSPTLRAMNHADSHANGGGQMAVAFQDRFRGDDGRGYGRVPPVSVEQIGTLETVKPWNVAQPIAFHPTQDQISSTDGTAHGLGCGSSGGQASVAVATPVGTDTYNGRITGDVAATLGTQSGDGVSSDPSVMHGMAVRRLTPVECERLQGFPDNYSQIPWRKKPASECPDGPRYKALGNSWAVPVVSWIGRRIAAAIAKSDAKAVSSKP